MHGFCPHLPTPPSPPRIIMGGVNLKISQNFVGAEVKIIWGEQYLLLQFHYFIYLEIANI